MMNFPNSENLPIHILAACFNKTVATYKFYWFLSIIQELEGGRVQIRKKSLFARMLSNSWYTANYFNLSYGKNDILKNQISAISEIENIPIHFNRETVCKLLNESKNEKTIKILNHFDNQVPHWFLSPWFIGLTGSDSEKKKKIYELNSEVDRKCLYFLKKETLEINPIWEDYLIQNAKFLKSFCYWNLTLFFQKHNPNVPDIANKIIKDANRPNLSKQRKEFWNLVFSELPENKIKCIYTGELITVDTYAVEHFVPHSFVAHDLIWNLIPADPKFNSSKNNRLPRYERFFEDFFKTQITGLKVICEKHPRNKFLEDYLTIFPETPYLEILCKPEFKAKFEETIKPLITIASNNGFQYLP